MNKTELINAMAEKANMTKKDAAVALDGVIDVISTELTAGNTVTLIGFGTFGVKEKAAREGRNPRTGEVVKIKASKAPYFKAGKGLKDQVNK